MAGAEWHAKATIWCYVIAMLSGMRGACIVCVCVWSPLAGGFPMPGCVRVRSGASYFPYMCVDTALAVVDDAYESSLSKHCECLHQGLEEGRVVDPRGGVGLGGVDFSYGPASLDLGSCGG